MFDAYRFMRRVSRESVGLCLGDNGQVRLAPGWCFVNDKSL